jgi:hypothetical protein
MRRVTMHRGVQAIAIDEEDAFQSRYGYFWPQMAHKRSLKRIEERLSFAARATDKRTC